MVIWRIQSSSCTTRQSEISLSLGFFLTLSVSCGTSSLLLPPIHTRIILINQLHPPKPKSIRLRITTHIPIKNNIHRSPNLIPWPHRFASIPHTPNPPRIRIQITHKAYPTRIHKLRQINIALSPALERIEVLRRISDTHGIVEYEGYFLEMRYCDYGTDVGSYGVEAVAICWDAGCGPSSACETTVCDEHYVAVIGR